MVTVLGWWGWGGGSQVATQVTLHLPVVHWHLHNDEQRVQVGLVTLRQR